MVRWEDLIEDTAGQLDACALSLEGPAGEQVKARNTVASLRAASHKAKSVFSNLR